jgi:hypothetical protein
MDPILQLVQSQQRAAAAVQEIIAADNYPETQADRVAAVALEQLLAELVALVLRVKAETAAMVDLMEVIYQVAVVEVAQEQSVPTVLIPMVAPVAAEVLQLYLAHR